METLKTYVNTKGISHLLIDSDEITSLPSTFHGNSLQHMHEKLTMADLSYYFY